MAAAKLQLVPPLVSIETVTVEVKEPLEMVKTLLPFKSGRPVVICASNVPGM